MNKLLGSIVMLAASSISANEAVHSDIVDNKAISPQQQAFITQQRLAGEKEHQNRVNRYNSLYIDQHHGRLYQDEAHRSRHGHEGRHPRRHSVQIQHPSGEITQH